MRVLMTATALLATVACGPADGPPTLPVTADVGFEQLDLVLVNQDGRDWTDATLTIDPGGLSATADRVKAGERHKISAGLFANPQGERFNPYTHKPVTFRLTATANGQPITWTTAFRYDRP